MPLDLNERAKLVEALLKCDRMKTPQSRSRIVRDLPAEIQHRIVAGGTSKEDVDEIVRVSEDFEGGLKALLDRVKYYEGEKSYTWKDVQEAVPWFLAPQAPPTPAPLLPASPRPDGFLYDVFLSHNSQDKPIVELIARRLEDEAGLKPFLDKWHLIPGGPWQEELEEALNASRTFAVFLGADKNGPWKNVEMRDALNKRANDRSRRVIPVLLPGADPADESTLPAFLKQLTWVDFRSGINDKGTFDRLVAGIRGQSPGRGTI